MKKRLCGWAGCSRITDKYYCPEHEKIAKARRKQNAYSNAEHNSSLYKTAEWRRFRADVIATHSWCSVCGAKASDVKLEVHHIVPVRDNPLLMYDRLNVMVLCTSCHAAETQREVNERKKRRDR